MGVDVKSLHPLEVRVLRHVEKDSAFSSEMLAESLGMKIGQCNQALSWLSAKELAALDRREEHTFFELTDLGETYAEIGTPIERIFNLVQSESGLKMPKELQRQNPRSLLLFGYGNNRFSQQNFGPERKHDLVYTPGCHRLRCHPVHVEQEHWCDCRCQRRQTCWDAVGAGLYPESCACGAVLT